MKRCGVKTHQPTYLSASMAIESTTNAEAAHVSINGAPPYLGGILAHLLPFLRCSRLIVVRNILFREDVQVDPLGFLQFHNRLPQHPQRGFFRFRADLLFCPEVVDLLDAEGFEGRSALGCDSAWLAAAVDQATADGGARLMMKPISGVPADVAYVDYAGDGHEGWRGKGRGMGCRVRRHGERFTGVNGDRAELKEAKEKDQEEPCTLIVHVCPNNESTCCSKRRAQGPVGRMVIEQAGIFIIDFRVRMCDHEY